VRLRGYFSRVFFPSLRPRAQVRVYCMRLNGRGYAYTPCVFSTRIVVAEMAFVADQACQRFSICRTQLTLTLRTVEHPQSTHARMHARTNFICAASWPQVNVSSNTLILYTPQIPCLLLVYGAYELALQRGEHSWLFTDSLRTNQECAWDGNCINRILQSFYYFLSGLMRFASKQVPLTSFCLHENVIDSI